MDPISAGEAAQQLSISPRDLRKIAMCGLLTAIAAGRTTLYDRGEVEALAARPSVTHPEPPVLVVRLGAPEEVERDPLWPERRWIGWREDWDEQTKQNAARGWWRVSDPASLHLLVAIVSRWTVGVWCVTGHERVLGHTRLDVASPTPEVAARWSGRTVALRPGPTSVRLG